VTASLVLAGHGSHLNQNSSDPVWSTAARIRSSSTFADVRVGFWKEEPSLSRVLDGCEAGDVTVVPFFISDGYFTRTVVPREMGLDGPLTVRGPLRIRYTPPVGAHPAIAGVIIERAREAGAGPGDAVAVLGHGTRRDSRSEKNVYHMASLVREQGPFARVEALFLDQDPNMLQLLEIFHEPTVVVVPLFVADGWHVGETIPDDLSLGGPGTRRAGRTVRYTPPVGTHPTMTRVVLELAREAVT